MIVDLHAHYPMHVRPAGPLSAALGLWSEQGRAGLVDRFDAAVIGFASRRWNHESSGSGPRVTVEGMRRGGVGVAMSVLCTPLLEMGNRFTIRYRRKPPYGAPPDDRYLTVLLRQLDAVERRVKQRHAGRARIARSCAELDTVIASDRVALVHCLEGAFSLGASPESIERAVGLLARRGIAYITIAHLAWRRVATNVPCAPFLSDATYNRIFPQPEVGLTELGRAAIRAMLAEGVLVDLTHMSEAALRDTLRLMDELDPSASVPVIASHCGFRFGRHEYNLTDATIERIAERDGVVGLMLSTYFMADGLFGPGGLEESVEILCRHVDRIASITGSHRHIAIGTDLDGFIKPTLPGLEDSARLGRLEPALEERYGTEVAEDIKARNALRVLRRGWRGGSGAAAASSRTGAPDFV